MGQFRDEVRGVDAGFPDGFAPDDALLPWIDVHGHHHHLGWNELEKFGLTGCSAIVMTVGTVAPVSPYRPVSADDIRRQWDQVVRYSHAISRSFPYEAYGAIGVHTTNGPVEEADSLIDRIPEYAELEEVVALSETGITSIQEHEAVPLQEQRRLIRRQLQQADGAGLPAILHTPTLGKADAGYAAGSTETHDTGEPVLDSDAAKLEGAQIAVEVAGEAGFPEDRLALTHAHPSMVSWVLENTESYVSFTVGNATRDVSPADVVSAVETYGPDRIMVDTDCAPMYSVDPFDVKRTMIALLRAGIDRDGVRDVVYGNQRELLGLDHLRPS